MPPCLWAGGLPVLRSVVMHWLGLWQHLGVPGRSFLLFLDPLSQGLSEPGRVPAMSLSVSYCRSGGCAPHLTGPVALGLRGLYALLSGLAIPSPGGLL